MGPDKRISWSKINRYFTLVMLIASVMGVLFAITQYYVQQRESMREELRWDLSKFELETRVYGEELDALRKNIKTLTQRNLSLMMELADQRDSLILMGSTSRDSISLSIIEPKDIEKIVTDYIEKAGIGQLSEKIASVEEELHNLEGSISPSNANEILSVVRVQDKIIQLEEKFTEIEKNLKNDQEQFERAIIRELDSRDKIFNYVFIVLIPMVIIMVITYLRERNTTQQKPSP